MFGAPGSGKGTHGKILGSIPGFFHCACGDVFRNLRADTELGKVFIEYSSHGRLVPDSPTIQLWRRTIDGSTQMGRFHPEIDTLVLDGIPRNVNQARILDSLVRVARIIYLLGSDAQVMINRIKRRAELEGRKDDADEDVIRRRLEVYRHETKPVLDYYPSGQIAKIDALGTPDEVGAAIQKELVAR